MTDELLCAILGDTNIFSVKFDNTQTVDDLKCAIKAKKKNALASHDADALKLYKVDINVSGDDDETLSISPDHDQVMEKISQKKTYTQEIQDLPQNRIKTNQELVNPTRTLSGVFGGSFRPVPTRIYVLVELPQAVGPSAPPASGVPELQTTPILGADIVDQHMAKARINSFIENLRPEIRRFLTNPRLPTWLPPESAGDQTRQFYRDLEVPLVKGKPCLLLHNLGNTLNPNADTLFRGNSHRILCNTSGAGKTRLLFEGLSTHWGFYFVTAQGSDGIGARDLEAVMEMMSGSPDWSRNIFMDPNSTGVRSVNHESQARNEAIASNNISKVILARWAIFQAFIEVANELKREGKHQGNLQRDWLLFQILPLVPIAGLDPFSALISQALDSVGTFVLKKLRSSFTPQSVLGPSFDSNHDSFFCVIDEAQVAGRRYMGAFADGSGTEQRPVLRPIIQEMTSPAIFTAFNVIVSGTSFSPEVFKTDMTSGVAKDSSQFDVIHTTGDFSERDAQFYYISRYLPPSFLASECGTCLRTRLYEWVRGRHRFTARFLEELLTRSWCNDRPAYPHKFLDAYVQRLADFKPSDSEATALRGEEGGEEDGAGPIEIETFQWDKIAKDHNLLDDLAHKIYTFILHGKTPTWLTGHKPLVEYGVARFTRVGTERTGITIDEPLALMSVIRYFESHAYSLVQHVRRGLREDKGTAMEEAVVLAMTTLLQNKRPLGSILTFRRKSPWDSLTAQIVARKSSGSFEDFPTDSLRVNPTFYAKGPDDVRHWLESREEAYCIPGNLMGPDMITRIRLSNGDVVSLFIQVKCHLTGNIKTLDAAVSAHAIRSLVPAKFFISLVRNQLGILLGFSLTAVHMEKNKHQGEARQQVVEEGIESMLDEIQKYKILRVVAAFPLDVNFKSSSKEVKRALAEDEHQLAKLSHGAFTETLATLQNGSWFMDSLKSSLKRSRAEFAEDDGPDAKTRPV